MSEEKIPSFDDLEQNRVEVEQSLQASLSPKQREKVEAVRAYDAKKLAQDKAAADEALAQRVAEILAGKMQGPRVHGTTLGQPARVVGHGKLVCRACGHTRSADHQSDSKTPSAGGCMGYAYLTHDFHGADTVITSVDSLASNHAIFVDGTVTHPARA